MPATPAIQTQNLSFGFHRKETLFQDLRLEIPAGSCFGLLGPNGAGKSTLMKLLLGLLRPARGEVWLLGTHLSPRKRRVYRQVGALIEEPKLYPNLTGRENLQVYATYRSLPPGRVEEVLHTTDMHRRAGRRVSTYSTGMKQRLGIALALLPDPELLVLDEPTNGLDPQGIAEIRSLILELHRNRTLLLSSHLLSEVEQTCTHLGVIHEGRLLFQGPMDELVQRKREAGIQVLVDVPADLEQLGIERPCRRLRQGRFQVLLPDREAVPALIDQLRSRQVDIFQLQLQERNLEESFLELFKSRPS